MFPLHVVCDWIGNSATIAQKHYLQVTDSDFERATNQSGKLCGAQTGAFGAKVVQKKAQTAPDAEGQQRTQPLDGIAFSPLLSSQVLSCQDVILTPRGFEPLSRP